MSSHAAKKKVQSIYGTRSASGMSSITRRPRNEGDGGVSLDQSIFSLFEQRLVTLDEALRWASNVDEFKLKVQGIATTSEMSRDDMAKTVLGAPEITRFGS